MPQIMLAVGGPWHFPNHPRGCYKRDQCERTQYLAENAFLLRDLKPTSVRVFAWPAAYLNGGLWALGNGLVSTALITFLAKDFGATSFHIGLILAFPHAGGVLRLAAPLLLHSGFERKSLSIASLVASGICLALLPIVSWPGVLATPHASLVALIVLWGAWHVWMYLGLIPLLSWFADLTTADRRGEHFGIRDAWMTFATIVGTVIASLLAAAWNARHPKNEQWIGLAGCALLGSLFVLASVLPLFWIGSVPRANTSRSSIAEMTAAFVDRKFFPLLMFNAWFSFANGLTVAALAIYPYAVLKLSAPIMLNLLTYTRVGQVITARVVGKTFDRLGYRNLMAAAQCVAACGVLFYLFATPERWWLIIGASTCWIAYVVLNVGLPPLALRLSPDGNSPSYLAVGMAVSGVSFACASVLGGWLLDTMRSSDSTAVASWPCDPFATLFLVGFVLRLGSAAWLLLLPSAAEATVPAVGPVK